MNNESLTQWEDRRREHFGSMVTLLLGLSSASLAYCGSLLSNSDTDFGGARSILFIFAAGSFTIALVAGIAVAFSRLQDARITARILRAQARSFAAGYIENLRSNAQFWGRLTWFGLYVQIFTFAAGALLLMLMLYILNSEKLFPKERRTTDRLPSHVWRQARE